MKLKKFVGRDMASILLKVKETLGEDAVIISSRKVGDNIEAVSYTHLTLPTSDLV